MLSITNSRLLVQGGREEKGKPMKVKLQMKRNTVVNGEVKYVGEEVEVDYAVARRLIYYGKACEAKRKKSKETAALKPKRKAVLEDPKIKSME